MHTPTYESQLQIAALREGVKQLTKQLADEKADHADTQQKWNEALDVGLKVAEHRDQLRDLVSERESRLANIKHLLEPIYGSTNYAPIGGTIDRVLNICEP